MNRVINILDLTPMLPPSFLIGFWTPAKVTGIEAGKFLPADNSIIVEDARPAAELVVLESSLRRVMAELGERSHEY